MTLSSLTSSSTISDAAVPALTSPEAQGAPPEQWNDTHDPDYESDWLNLNDEWDSEEPPLESDWHRDQIDWLVRLLQWAWRDREDFYVSGNTTVYYDLEERTNRNFRGPDFYVVLGTSKRKRRSWMVWREAGKYPNVVIELLSSSTARVDRTTKFNLYQTTWRVLDYFWFHPQTLEFQGFQLVNGEYQPIQPNDQGHRWSEQLQLYLGLHEGQLRFFSPDGALILSEEEESRQQAEQERQQAEQERQRAEQAEAIATQERQRAEQAEAIAAQERQRAETLAERLRQLGLE